MSARRHLATTVVRGRIYPYAWCINNEEVYLIFYINNERVFLKDLEKYSSSSAKEPLWLGKYRRVDKRGFWIYSKRYASLVIKQYLDERKATDKHKLL